MGAPAEYLLQSKDPFGGADTCVPSLQRGGGSQPVPLIFGMTFMRAFYTNFDVKRHRIGLARSRLSPLAANSFCAVYPRPLVRRVLWWTSLVVAMLSVLFCLYVFLDLRCEA